MAESTPLPREDQELIEALNTGVLDFSGPFLPSEQVSTEEAAAVPGDWSCIECEYKFDSGFQPQIRVLLENGQTADMCSAVCAEARGFMAAATVWRMSVELGQGWAVVVNRNGRRLYPGEGQEPEASTVGAISERAS